MKRLSLFVVLILSLGLLAGCNSEKDTVIVGSKDFTEQYILGNMLTLLIESNTKLAVTYKSDLSSDVLFAATRTGAVDLYVEYTGTVYGSYFRYSDVKNPQEVFEIVERELMERYSLRALCPLGFNNTYALAVRADTAATYDLNSISDLAKVSSDLVFGGFVEFLNRYDGVPNLKLTYDMVFSDEVVVETQTRYQDLINDKIQVLEVYATDGMLSEYNLVVLEDDKTFFPAYEGIIIIRDDAVQKHPELLEVICVLTNLLDDAVMRDLNYRVDISGESPKSVAEDFLRTNGLIK
ncbi:MAG: hypothetical protein LBC96_09090 [Lachnospiraceae bacterium]|jgi:osmoprotectant transport system permease protein|nr:hypothetical protein [Lachnospiraceae bacterium]